VSRRTILLLSAALAVVSGGWIAAPLLLRRMAFFHIRQVEVIGNRYLDEQDVVRRLGLASGASIFDPLDKVRAAAAAIPGTVGSSASVERRFPGTLRVKLVETVPVALTAVNDRLALLDYRGRVLPFDPVHAPTSLPVAEHDSMTAALLARLRLADPRGYDEVQTARPDHGDILLDLGEHSIRVRPNADDETLRSIAAVRGWLADSSRQWVEIDARYSGRVFVKKARS
jgi:cell division septal protein FtsQ